MTSLELINEEIELIKEYLKSKDIYGLKSKRYTEKRLQTLLQIKTKLEAWKVVNNTFNILPRYDYNDPEIYILSKDGEKEISQYVSREEYNKVTKAKALEVEDERIK